MGRKTHFLFFFVDRNGKEKNQHFFFIAPKLTKTCEKLVILPPTRTKSEKGNTKGEQKGKREIPKMKGKREITKVKWKGERGKVKYKREKERVKEKRFTISLQKGGEITFSFSILHRGNFH